MRAELEEKQPKLIASGKETAELIALVEVQTAEADKVKTLVQVRLRRLGLGLRCPGA